jgi:CRISPR/Cas system CMR subunit Cmr4 (Cas7 group RAMP superfamily)
MGERLKDGQLPTEGEVWFADATLLLFPIASYSHQFLWITCPLWLSRWNRWLDSEVVSQICRSSFREICAACFVEVLVTDLGALPRNS